VTVDVTVGFSRSAHRCGHSTASAGGTALRSRLVRFRLVAPRFDAFERHGVVSPGRAESGAAEPSVSARSVEIIAPNFFVMSNMQATFVVDVAGKKEKEK